MKKLKHILAFILSAAVLFSTGMDSLAVKKMPEETKRVHKLKLVQPEHGSLALSDDLENAGEDSYSIPSGTEVKASARPEAGYEIDRILLNGDPVEYSPNTEGAVGFSFRMPDCDTTLELTVIRSSSASADSSQANDSGDNNPGAGSSAPQNPASSAPEGTSGQTGSKVPSGSENSASESSDSKGSGSPGSSSDSTRSVPSNGSSADTQPEPSQSAVPSARISPASAGNTITSAYIKKGSQIPGGIDVILWENGEWTSLDHWSEGILGTTSGEWLFCADPTQNFKEGLTMTSHSAREYYSQDTIDTVCALLYYMDNYSCSGLTDDQKYMMKQAFLWTALNHSKHWYTGGDYVEINYGNGLTCSCGYNVAGHYRDHYDDGIRWLEANRDSFEASGEIFTNGENQPLSRWTYEYHPTGYVTLQKSSAYPEVTSGNSCYSIAGAEYGVYRDEACKDQVGTLRTDETGNSNILELDQGQYYVKETKAPRGYVLDTKVYTAALEGSKTTVVRAQDVPLTAPVQILLEKSDRDTSLSTPQGKASLAGAEFTVRYYDGTYDSDPAATGKKPLRTLVLKTGSDGTARLDPASKVSGDAFYHADGKAVLPLGTVTIQETKAPAGYLPNSEIFIRQVTAEGSSVSTWDTPEIPEEVIRGGVRVEKWDHELAKNTAQGGATLEGAQFNIISLNPAPVTVGGKTFQNGEVVRTLKTDSKGTAATPSDLLPYGDYRITETSPPKGYTTSGITRQDFSITEDGVLVSLGTSQTAVRNTVIRGGIRVEKWDSELDQNKAQGSATLEGARFDIISLNEAPVLVNGASYDKNEVVATLTTDKTGSARTKADLLPYGSYRLKEVTPPKGYNKTGTLSSDFHIRENGKLVSLDTSSTAIKNDIIRGDLEIVKFAEPVDGEEDQMPPLKGIIFEITSKTTGEVFEITTDKNGYASTTQLKLSSRGNLVYDTYTVHEKNTPNGLDSVDDFEVSISEEGQTLYYILEDKQILSPIRLVKTDSTTGRAIPIAGAEFRLLDKDKDPITMTTYYPDKTVYESFTTDENGAFLLPEKLPAGSYYFREVNAPSGYLLGEDLPFRIEEGRDWSEPLAVKYENTPAMGRIRITKTDSESGAELARAEFTITAAEDIITGDGTIRAEKGETVDTITTGDDGSAQSKELYLGKYTITETKQPEGYALPDEPLEVELEYAGQNTPIVTESLNVANAPTKLIIQKISGDTEEPLEGVTFAIWKKDAGSGTEDSGSSGEGGAETDGSSEESGAEIDNSSGEDLAEVGSIIQPPASAQNFVTDKNGQITLPYLPPGTYCILETEGLPGYAFDGEIREITIGQDGRIGGEPSMTMTVENQKTKITQTSAVSTDTGTRLGIAREDTVIRDTVSMVDLQIGQEYLLRAELMDTETGAPLENADNITVSAEKTFTADASDMEIEIEIPLDASALAGRTITVFDTLYIGDTEAAAHKDISAESQQVTFPEHQIGTTALGEQTGTHDLPAEKDAVIIDTVSYKGLIPGLEYELRGAVADKETGKIFLENKEELWVSQTFTPESDTGTVEMRFCLDTSGLAGKEFVIFEYLWQGDDLVTSHEDPSDKGQTVRVLSPEEVKKEVPGTGDDAGLVSLAALAGLTGLAAITGAGAYLASRRKHRRRGRRRHS